MNSYKVVPILRMIMTDLIDLIQAVGKEDSDITNFYINKIVADLGRIQFYLKKNPDESNHSSPA
ncbi:hypothetical protein LCGC14_1632780 [marine sediment metagenome]|uniref:Uncharacterized protein n=1 Tax=marine sediment metagenome TaxID=412755 RepID=A0A0F9L1Z2_9ZZZZ